MSVARSVIALVFMMMSLGACANLDLARAGHDAIKQANCEQSEPRGACNRDWGEDFSAWQAQRAAYLASLKADKTADQTQGWLQAVDASGLPDL